MPPRPIDPHAVQIPQASRLPPCLYVPVAARDLAAIEAYVGRVARLLACRVPARAVLVDAYDPAPPDARLPIWHVAGVAVLHARAQVWVHVDYGPYRHTYAKAFPDAVLGDLVLDHVMNRRVARLKGYAYLRLVPVSRAVNSSHGGLSERWAVEYQSSPRMREINAASRASVQYADLADLVKMLDVEGGGSLMDRVNDTQALVVPPAAPSA